MPLTDLKKRRLKHALLLIVKGALMAVCMVASVFAFHFISYPVENTFLPLIMSMPGRLGITYRHMHNYQHEKYWPRTPTENPYDAHVWQYEYMPPGADTSLTGPTSFATDRKYWRTPWEARVVVIGLFGDKEFYYKAVLRFLDSIGNMNKRNGVPEGSGLNTFIFRIYLGKKPPGQATKDNNPPNDKYVTELLKRNVELAYVDNHQVKYGLDGTFWRFLVFDEQMRNNDRVRYLVRDADWLAVGTEFLSVYEWIMSGMQFHRSRLFQASMSCLIANQFGGFHEGTGGIPGMKHLVETFPFRTVYGDDEWFLRDWVWPSWMRSGSVLTHIKPYSTFMERIAYTRKWAAQTPTHDYCKAWHRQSNFTCTDSYFPDEAPFPWEAYVEREVTEEDVLAIDKRSLSLTHYPRGQAVLAYVQAEWDRMEVFRGTTDPNQREQHIAQLQQNHTDEGQRWPPLLNAPVDLLNALAKQ